MLQLCRLREAVHHIHGHPVPALGIDLAPVDNKGIGQSSGSSRLIVCQFDLANAERDTAEGRDIFLFHLVCTRESDTHIRLVQLLLTIAVWPPQARSNHIEARLQLCVTHFQAVTSLLPSNDRASITQSHFHIRRDWSCRVQFSCHSYLCVVKSG